MCSHLSDITQREISDTGLKTESSSSKSKVLPVVGVISPITKERNSESWAHLKLCSTLIIHPPIRSDPGVHTGLVTYLSSCVLMIHKLFCVYAILLLKTR